MRRAALSIVACCATLGFVVGCGGSGSSSSASVPPALSHYILDPAVTPLPGNTTIAGVSPSGAWMVPASIDNSPAGTSGYYVNGVLQNFPFSKVAGATSTNLFVVAVGGNFLWANFLPAGSVTHTLVIYNLSTGAVVKVPNCHLDFQAATCPDGTSSFVHISPSDGGVATDTYAVIDSAGHVTDLTTMPAGGSFTALARSNSGFTVGTFTPTAGTPENLLFSPANAVTILKGLPGAFPMAVNNSGISVGSDAATLTGRNDLPVKWDAKGTETILKTLSGTVSDTDSALCIDNAGKIIGISGPSSNVVRWVGNAAPVNLSAEFVPSGGISAINYARAVQDNGKILAQGTGTLGNDVLIGITPSK